jgi:hypothetical protein
MKRKHSEAAARFEERARQEDLAPRLTAEVPGLASLRIELEEFRDDNATPLVRHVRVIVVDRAPAMFRILCSDPDCTDGGYDLTRGLLRELRASATTIEGVEECNGYRHGGNCVRKLRYIARATFSPHSQAV